MMSSSLCAGQNSSDGPVKNQQTPSTPNRAIQSLVRLGGHQPDQLCKVVFSLSERRCPLQRIAVQSEKEQKYQNANIQHDKT